jgi:hypothetical protein
VAPVLIAAATTVSDLVPYLALIGAGFLLGAWGQVARVPLAVVVGIALILVAIVVFVLDNGGGDPGVPGL